jgi:WD40 repeat protein
MRRERSLRYSDVGLQARYLSLSFEPFQGKSMASFIRVKCSCGKALRVPSYLQGKRVECPACGGSNLVAAETARPRGPAPESEPSSRSMVGWVALCGIASLLLLGGLLFFVFSGDDENSEDGKQVQFQEPSGKKAAPSPLPVTPRKLEVAFDRIEPPQPEEGKSATVYLKDVGEKGDGLVFQYRQGSSEAWQTAMDGRFSLPSLQAGPLTLEARLTDGKGNTSPVAKHVITVAKAPVVAVAPSPKGLELALQTGHIEPITSVAISSDGKHIVSASRDKAILREAVSAKQLRTFQHQDYSIGRAAISGDGKRVATVSIFATVILWDAASGEKLQTLLHPEGGYVKGVAFSDDGRYVVTGSENKTASLWEAASGKKLQTLQGHTGPIWSVALSGDGRHVITGSDDKTAILWETATGKRLQTFEHATSVYNVAVSSDGRHVLTGPSEKAAILWDATNGKQLQTFEAHKRVTSLALSRDAQRVLTASSYDRTAVLWEGASGRRLHTFDEPIPGTFTDHDSEYISQWSYNAALSGDGQYLVILPQFGPGGLWKTDSGKKVQTFQGHSALVTSVAVSADGARVATGSRDKRVTVWDIAGGKMLQTLLGHTKVVNSVALSADGKYVVGGAEYGKAILWEIDRGTKLQTFDSGWVMTVAIRSDGQQVATGYFDGTAAVWEAASGKKLQTFRGHSKQISTVAMSADGKNVLTGSSDGTAILWDSASANKLQAFTLNAGLAAVHVALSRDGMHALTGSYHRMILWETTTGKKSDANEEIKNWAIMSAAMNSDGKYVAVGLKDHALVWEAAHGNKLKTFQGTNHVWPTEVFSTQVALNADGKHLWTAPPDGTTRLWDTATGKERCRLYSFDAGEDWLVVTPDGLFDGSAGAWRLVAYRDPASGTLIDDDDTRKKFHRPGLLAHLWKSNPQ